MAFSTEPGQGTAGRVLVPAIQVAARTESGQVDVQFTGEVAVGLGTNPTGTTLNGTTTVAAVRGVATFDDLRIDATGQGYTLAANSAGFTSVISQPFNVISPPTSRSDTIPIPLMDMTAAQTYLGFPGGLYPAGNTMPQAHAAAGQGFAAAVAPLDVNGNPDPNGRYILVSIGMSNTAQEFCSPDPSQACSPGTFGAQAAADGSVNHSSLALINGAYSSLTADSWEAPQAPAYDRVRDDVLGPAGLSEQQVQIAWVKLANAGPTVSLPDANADAYDLERRLGNVMRALKQRYPNLQQVFLSSRIYGGYATTDRNPEPYAYESGLSVKWLIEAQINQMTGGVVDGVAGDLNYNNGTVPWLAWSAYMWANGVNPRSDGLVWLRGDFVDDGTHPSQSGEQKVGTLLLNFFKSSPQTTAWFLD